MIIYSLSKVRLRGIGMLHIVMLPIVFVLARDAGRGHQLLLFRFDIAHIDHLSFLQIHILPNGLSFIGGL
jgi:hypothetical protein